jgi:hypothetical protein
VTPGATIIKLFAAVIHEWAEQAGGFVTKNGRQGQNSSLLGPFVNYGCKKSYNIDTWLRFVGFGKTTGLIILCVMFNKSSHVVTATGPGVNIITLFICH